MPFSVVKNACLLVRFLGIDAFASVEMGLSNRYLAMSIHVAICYKTSSKAQE
jgi:hypothetical protein